MVIDCCDYCSALVFICAFIYIYIYCCDYVLFLLTTFLCNGVQTSKFPLIIIQIYIYIHKICSYIYILCMYIYCIGC